MMSSSFFTQETAKEIPVYCIEAGIWPYKAVVSPLPFRTLVVGHNDLSTGGGAGTRQPR